MPIPLITQADLPSWQPEGTVVAFLGGEAVMHAALHEAAISSMSALKPELSGWRCIPVECPADKLKETLAQLHAKRIWGVVLTAPLKSAALDLLSPTPSAKVGLAARTAEPDPIPMGSAEALAETHWGYKPRAMAPHRILWDKHRWCCCCVCTRTVAKG
jgi:hypothetical protein